MRPTDLFILSDNAVTFLNTYVSPIVMQDYIGWTVPLPKKFKSVFIIDYSEDKCWNILHKDIRKRLTKRQIKKSIKFLCKKGWLLPAYTEPFQEYSPELKVDMNKSIIIPPGQEVSQESIIEIVPELGIEYDDDISGITILDDDSSKGEDK